MSPAEEARYKRSENSLGVRFRTVPPRVDFVPARIDLQVTHRDDFLASLGRAPQERTHAREKFREMEGLDQIVVGAEIKSFDPIGNAVARR